MSDLVKRLRQLDSGWPTLLSTAADRIEQLERELAEANLPSDINRVNAMDEANWKPAGQYWRERAEKAEAERDAIAAAAFEAAANLDGIEGYSNAVHRHRIRALTPADAKAALDRMLEKAKAAVKVKPLEFVGTVAKTKFGFYRVWPCEDGFWRVGFDSRLLLISNPITTENAAKEAAQADYERRILSALK